MPKCEAKGCGSEGAVKYVGRNTGRVVYACDPKCLNTIKATIAPAGATDSAAQIGRHLEGDESRLMRELEERENRRRDEFDGEREREAALEILSNAIRHVILMELKIHRKPLDVKDREALAEKINKIREDVDNVKRLVDDLPENKEWERVSVSIRHRTCLQQLEDLRSDLLDLEVKIKSHQKIDREFERVRYSLHKLHTHVHRMALAPSIWNTAVGGTARLAQVPGNIIDRAARYLYLH